LQSDWIDRFAVDDTVHAADTECVDMTGSGRCVVPIGEFAAT
jgi:hypothetical protein